GLVQDASDKFGDQCIVVAIDAKRRPVKKRGEISWEVYTHGGRTATGLSVLAWAEKVVEMGAGELLVTSMDRDGTQTGYDIDLLKAIASRVQVPVIASGGAGNLKHLYEGFALGQADAVLAASIFHFGTYTLEQAKAYLREKEIPVRP